MILGKAMLNGTGLEAYVTLYNLVQSKNNAEAY